jgi:hypothetical protein
MGDFAFGASEKVRNFYESVTVQDVGLASVSAAVVTVLQWMGMFGAAQPQTLAGAAELPLCYFFGILLLVGFLKRFSL